MPYFPEFHIGRTIDVLRKKPENAGIPEDFWINLKENMITQSATDTQRGSNIFLSIPRKY